MPRNMSFSMTTAQFRARTKTVTRRLGWWNLKPGDVIMGVEKAMGLKKGEKVKRLGRIRIVRVGTEILTAITDQEVIREGFADMTPAAFVAMFCSHHKVVPQVPVNRIEFEYLD